jgi:hypothetical protein
MTSLYNRLMDVNSFSFKSFKELSKGLTKKKRMDLLKSFSSDAVHFQLCINERPAIYLRSKPLELLINDLKSKNAELNSLFREIEPSLMSSYLEMMMVKEIEASLSFSKYEDKEDDIFFSLHEKRYSASKEVSSFCLAYSLLKEGVRCPLSSLEDVSNSYMRLFRGLLKEEEEPDGLYFRDSKIKGSDIDDEQGIKYALKETLYFLSSPGLSIYEKCALLSFFTLYSKPFYKGNLSFSSYLSSSLLFNEAGPCSSFIVARSIKEHRRLIDEAYKDSISRSGYSDISIYVYFFLKALGESYSSAIMALRKKRAVDVKEDELGRLLSLASSYSLYGLSIRDLSKMLSLSSRSIIRHLSLYKEKGLLRIVKIQKALYYSLL